MPAEATQSWGGVAWLTCSNAISGLKAYAASIIAYADPITAYAALIIAVIALIVSIVGLGYSYRWWRRQQQQSNTLEQNLAEAAARITVGLACVVMIIFIGSSFVANKLSKPITPPAEKIYIAYEPYPILPFVTCPQSGSTCHPPTLFLRIKWNISVRSMEDKSYFRDAKDYKEPKCAEVAKDLDIAEMYNYLVLKQLEQASTAVEERDTTISSYMYRAQTEFARLEWSRRVGSDVASGYPIPNKTSTRIFCDYLINIGNSQDYFLNHTAITKLEQSLHEQQDWTLQTLDDIEIVSDLTDPWFGSSNSAMRSLASKLDDVFDLRVQQDSSHAKDFRKYKAMEKDALERIRRRQSTVCERANREDSGEKEEMAFMKIELRVMDISGMMWYFGSLVRKGATHISAYTDRVEEESEH
ncbi:hypothetical protein HBI56_221500 [Parastagonospora nodorum]|nr:hypothetical protein HBI09_215280 [Parastagonospora nodorum]KAH4216941.1 hypothetical protein HBI06_222720 [Parastagonospora nodorum]KAH4226180.1 hypothetical protein HBI05_224390 [Parastagonospora nodorum]KAH4335494.1 hypothetical protein HBH98_234450 [Parastagonospora nodorum]KAH4358219.1 hypothetical protein HBH97_219350 [Parastagonospora nodorum]